MKILNPKQRNAARRLVDGESVRDVAEQLGMSPQTVRNWMKEPIFQATMSEIELSREMQVVDRRSLDALEILESAASDAAALCADVVQSNDPDVSLNLKVKTAWDILDRTKGKPVQRQITATANIVDLILMAHDELSKNDSGRNSSHEESDLNEADPEDFQSSIPVATEATP